MFTLFCTTVRRLVCNRKKKPVLRESENRELRKGRVNMKPYEIASWNIKFLTFTGYYWSV